MSYKKKQKSHLYCPREGYDLFAGDYDESLRYLDSFEKDSLYNMFDDLNGKRVMDVGCGTGRIIGELRRFGAEVVGVDCSEKMIAITSKKFPDIEAVVHYPGIAPEAPNYPTIVSYERVGEALPPGITLNTTTGAMTGSAFCWEWPLFGFEIRVTDSEGHHASKEFFTVLCT